MNRFQPRIPKALALGVCQFRMPMFCSSLKGATKFDTFEGLAAKERALGVRDLAVRDGAKVLAFRRQDIFPEKYINPYKNKKNEC